LEVIEYLPREVLIDTVFIHYHLYEKARLLRVEVVPNLSRIIRDDKKLFDHLRSVHIVNIKGSSRAFWLILVEYFVLRDLGAQQVILEAQFD
jgi:hypothetical protein